jgi:hypothetical protein
VADQEGGDAGATGVAEPSQIAPESTLPAQVRTAFNLQ